LNGKEMRIVGGTDEEEKEKQWRERLREGPTKEGRRKEEIKRGEDSDD